MKIGDVADGCELMKTLYDLLEKEDEAIRLYALCGLLGGVYCKTPIILKAVQKAIKTHFEKSSQYRALNPEDKF